MPQDIVKRLAFLYILLVLYYGLRPAVDVDNIDFNEDNFHLQFTDKLNKTSDIVFS